MGSYRKKPVVVEAFHLTLETRNDNATWPDWLNRAWNKEDFDDGAVFPFPETNELVIKTLEGPMRCQIGDWIIKGVKGELYPCKDEIFRMTYEIPPSQIPGFEPPEVFAEKKMRDVQLKFDDGRDGYDEESAHKESDSILLDLLRHIGFEKVVKAFEEVRESVGFYYF